MAKLINKDKLKYKKGFFYKKDNLVKIEKQVASNLTYLDLLLQHSKYNKNKSMSLDMVKKIKELTDKDFKRVSEHTPKITARAETKHLDKAIKRSMKIVDDLRTKDATDSINDLIHNKLSYLVNWVEEPEVLISKKGCPGRLDLPVVGNPLELTTKRLMNMLEYIAKYHSED